ncbi:MAG: asparagine synthase (glutamine-hydrolyzing) [bacterium]|nr:asparagine synthase (glutamine-hydrolyzing) [bacterium]
MCGFIGIFGDIDNINIQKIKNATQKLKHRGPDDEGYYKSKNFLVGFRRLAIIDLSKKGAQPMKEDSLVIVFNGEIYNFNELKVNYLKNEDFISNTDTEVLLKMYKNFGKDALNYLRGMFAFCIFSELENSIFLARDRIGKKPLYYTYNDKNFIFSSEIKTILEFIDKIEVDLEALYDYLSFLVTPAPKTLFKNIFKLEPSHYLIVKYEKKINVKKFQYYNLLSNSHEPTFDEKYIANKLYSLFDESVKLRMVSDVPVGVFLSGGIDSSINTALFSKYAPITKTFSIGYKIEKYNEFNYARIVATKFNTKHFEIIIDENDFINFIPQMVYFQDEPIADPVCVPLYYVSKLARENGVIVCQVGEGSDELFCGYPDWLKYLKLNQINEALYFMPKTLKKAFFFLIKNLFGIIKRRGVRIDVIRRIANEETVFWGGATGFTEIQKKLLLNKKLSNIKESSYWFIKEKLEKFMDEAKEKSFLNFMAYLDLSLRIPELLLMRVDKMTMANSLEARTPFLDHKFVEFSISIPEKIKIGNGITKRILKEAFKKILPIEVLNRPKQGFGIPVYEWFYSNYGVKAKKILDDFLSETDYFNKKFINELYFNPSAGMQVWFLINFALWHRVFIENKNINF